MEKFDKEWLRGNGINVSDEKASKNGMFFLRDGHSIVVVNKKAERKLLETLRKITERSFHDNSAGVCNGSTCIADKMYCSGNPPLIEGKQTSMIKLNDALDRCVASYMGD